MFLQVLVQLDNQIKWSGWFFFPPLFPSHQIMLLQGK